MSGIECGYPGTPTNLEAVGPRLNILVGFDPTYRPSSNQPPRVPERPLSALVDTGADLCCIDSKLAISLKLPVLDHHFVAHGVMGSGDVNLYLAQIVIPELPFTVYGRFAGLELAELGCSALIGRAPVLTHCVMTYDGPSGSVQLALNQTTDS